MVAATKPTVAGTCLGCGELVTADAAFCPVCGTRQIPDRPMSSVVLPEETARLGRSTNAWLAVAIVAAAVLLFVTGMLVGWLRAAMVGDDGDDAKRVGEPTVTAAEVISDTSG